MLGQHFMLYNLARNHRALRVAPAMQAGIVDHVFRQMESPLLKNSTAPRTETFPTYSPALARELRGELTQVEMAALVGYQDGKRWGEFETGARPPGPRSWELALIKRDCHPLYGPRGAGRRPRRSFKSPALPSFSPALARELRGELTQVQMAALTGFSSGNFWGEVETGVRSLSALSWELVLIKRGRHPWYGPRRTSNKPQRVLRCVD